jgi:hypothetical protein
MPEETNAEIAAVGPGIETTRMFSAAAAWTRRNPGSLMPGVPASETTEFFDQLCGAVALVVFVIADGASLDAVVIQQLLCVTSVFAGDEVDFVESANGAEGDVFKIADGSRDDEQGAGHARILASPAPGSKLSVISVSLWCM